MTSLPLASLRLARCLQDTLRMVVFIKSRGWPAGGDRISRKLMEERDVLVIGSGFGGLAAGALAAASGLAVEVVEQHTRPGGCAGDFALDGFLFPAGATVITGLESGGILRRVLDASGTHVDSLPLDPSLTLHIGGKALPYARSHGEWQRTFSHAFPDAPPGYRRFWDWAHRVGGVVYRLGAAMPSLPIEHWRDALRTLPALRAESLETLLLTTKTVEDMKQRFGAMGHHQADAVIEGLLIDATGATAHKCSAIQGAIALDIYRRGCQWVEGGPARIARELVRAIRRQSGTVSFGQRVDRLRRARTGWLAQTVDGRAIHARQVVANMPPHALDGLRGRPERRPRDQGWGAFVLHLGIDATGLDPLSPFHQVVRHGEGTGPEDGGACFVSIFPGRHRHESRWTISVSTHTAPGDWETSEEKMQCRRRRMEQSLLEAADEVLPGVEARVRVLRSAIPRTFERYTLRPGGFVGGLVQRPDRVALRAPGRRVAKGLVLAGDHVFPGQGTVGVALSGVNAYRDICDDMGVEALL